MAQQAFQLNNPAGLYDPAPNAYSHVARLEPGVRLVCLAGQGGEATHQYGVTAFSDCHSVPIHRRRCRRLRSVATNQASESNAPRRRHTRADGLAA